MTSNEPVEAEIVSDEPTKRKHNVKKYPKDTWSVNRVFWGMLFVVIGGIMLASNFNIVEVNWMNLWKLWPLIVIAFGLSILSIRHWVWKLLSVLMILATMFAIVWVSVVGDIYSSNFETYSANIKVMSSNVKSAEVSVKAGASSINVNSNDQNSVAEASLTSNVANIKKSSTIKNNIQYVYLGMNPNKNSSCK
jgi:hypothetical protein